MEQTGAAMMGRRIELECRGNSPETVKELNLDNCRSDKGAIEGLSERFDSLEVLSLINTGLTTLKNFPALPNLRKLELSENRISSGLGVLANCPKLTHLTLSNNKIKDLEALEPLKKLENLQAIDLYHCDVTNIENYREKVFELLPQLKYLDGLDRYDKEENDSEEDELDDDVSGEDSGSENDEEDEDEGDVGSDVVVEDDSDEDSEDEDGTGGKVDDGASDSGSEPGLEYLQKSDLVDDDDEEDDFNPDGEVDEDEDLDDEEEDGVEAEVEQRGQKRKRDPNEEDEDDD
ncbi:acidic leucine-rich nuclear phosphoprotein 32 family member A-like isoform X3 [Acanthaster planci]|uniref:Acidic leucine-rich nuclear phosphoprotein 32 family member A-like isoform X3 n=1 Tax=Acanthaster planci TaxID=133434 RepID=A0A8B7XWC3_ACAPL|nr:acidic leucine-rich nuclear phosphoprotein 32 family member A-like isoform X3 [Acanthaster planci]